MAERHYKREKARGISLGEKGYDQARAFRTRINIRKAFQSWRDQSGKA